MGRRLFSGDLSPLPDHLRCRRSDGRQWRCPQPAKLGLSFCDYHHQQVRRNQDFSNTNDAAAAEPKQSPRLMDNLPLERKRRRRLREDPPAEKPVSTAQKDDGQVEMEVTSDAANGVVDVPIMVTDPALTRNRRRRMYEESPSPSKEPIRTDQREKRLVEMEPSDLKVRDPRFPYQLRCGRWQCEQWAMPGISFCDYHRLRCKQPNKEITMPMERNPKQRLRIAADPQSSMKRRQRWLRLDPRSVDPISTAQREGVDSAAEAPEAVVTGHLPLPDPLRCRRSDGKKWRCSEPSIPGLSFCEYHQMRCKQANLRNTMIASAKPKRRQRLSADSLPATKRRRKKVREPPADPTRMAQEGLEEAGLETSDYNQLRWKECNSKNEEEAAKPKQRPRLLAAIQGTSTKDISLPDHLRCRRSDGRGWRCHKMAMPCLGFCEYHYLQLRRNQKNNKKTKLALAKCKWGPRLAANSLHDRKLRRQQLREELSMQEPIRLAQKDGDDGMENPDIEVTRDLPHGVMAISPPSVSAPINAVTSLDLKLGSDNQYLLGRRFRSKNAERVPLGTLQRLPFPRSVGGCRMRICHRCRGRANQFARIIGCLSCQEFFCTTCIETWHPELSEVQVKMCCPVCRGCCSCINCHFIRDEDGGSKELVIHQNKFSTTKYNHHLICHLIPLLKHINGEQIAELEAEASNQGRRLLDVQIQVAKYSDEEQVNCNHCGSKINDFYRSCSMCTYRFCFSCCHNIRGGIFSKGNGMAPCKNSKRRHPYYRVDNDVNGKKVGVLSRKHVNTLVLCTSTVLPDWTTNNDGSISCPPKELGGCGDGILNIYFSVTSDSAT